MRKIKGQISFDLITGIIIIIVGVPLIIAWAFAETLGQPDLSLLTKWGIALLPIVIEIIQRIVKELK